MTENIWSCKIGECSASDLADGADRLLRQAIMRAYEELTGRPADFIFSGWGAELDEHEKAVVSLEQAAD